jgi:hypothetical protein
MRLAWFWRRLRQELRRQAARLEVLQSSEPSKSKIAAASHEAVIARLKDALPLPAFSVL